MKTQNILEILKDIPDQAAQSRDDQKCKALFEQLGMLGSFATATTPNLSLARYRDHKTHWILGMLWSGYPRPSGNGYQVICLPKSQIPEQGMEKIAELILGTYHGHSREDYVIRLP